MCSRVAQRRGSSSPRRLGSNRLSSRCGSSRPHSSRAQSSAAAETRAVRGQKAHVALRRVLSNSTKLRNAKVGRRLSNHAKVGREVVSNAKSARFTAKLF